MTKFIIFFSLFSLVFLFFIHRRDAKRIKMKTLDAVSPELRSEIIEEKKEYHRKKSLFEKALKAGAQKNAQFQEKAAEPNEKKV